MRKKSGQAQSSPASVHLRCERQNWCTYSHAAVSPWLAPLRQRVPAAEQMLRVAAVTQIAGAGEHVAPLALLPSGDVVVARGRASCPAPDGAAPRSAGRTATDPGPPPGCWRNNWRRRRRDGGRRSPACRSSRTGCRSGRAQWRRGGAPSAPGRGSRRAPTPCSCSRPSVSTVPPPTSRAGRTGGSDRCGTRRRTDPTAAPHPAGDDRSVGGCPESCAESWSSPLLPCPARRQAPGLPGVAGCRLPARLQVEAPAPRMGQLSRRGGCRAGNTGVPVSTGCAGAAREAKYPT